MVGGLRYLVRDSYAFLTPFLPNCETLSVSSKLFRAYSTLPFAIPFTEVLNWMTQCGALKHLRVLSLCNYMGLTREHLEGWSAGDLPRSLIDLDIGINDEPIPEPIWQLFGSKIRTLSFEAATRFWIRAPDTEYTLTPELMEPFSALEGSIHRLTIRGHWT